MKKFKKLFPEEKSELNLELWHKYEVNNPETFSSMFNFWTMKK